MNAIEAYRKTLWNNIPTGLRYSISDSIDHGRFWTSYYILIGTPMWEKCKDIADTLDRLGYNTVLDAHTDDIGEVIEYELKIYWDKPREATY